MREEHCQVFAKTTAAAFDPFAADEYVPRFRGSATAGLKEERGEAYVADDSARRVDGEVKEESANGQRQERFFSGSSRYLLVRVYGSILDKDLGLTFSCVDRWLECRS